MKAKKSRMLWPTLLFMTLFVSPTSSIAADHQWPSSSRSGAENDLTALDCPDLLALDPYSQEMMILRKDDPAPQAGILMPIDMYRIIMTDAFKGRNLTERLALCAENLTECENSRAAFTTKLVIAYSAGVLTVLALFAALKN